MRRTPKVFFLHNPKAGGTSLRKLFLAHFIDREVSPVFDNAPMEYRLLGGKYEQFKGYRFYCCHTGYAAYEALDDGHVLVSNFRHPTSRIFSLYNYCRNNTSNDTINKLNVSDASCVMEAKYKNFSEFIRSDNPSLKLYTHDAHFRQILNSPWELYLGNEVEIQNVKSRISNMYWHYVAEFSGISMRIFRKLFGTVLGRRLEVSNKSLKNPGEGSISDEDFDHILRINPRDTIIYRHAVARLMDSVQE